MIEHETQGRHTAPTAMECVAMAVVVDVDDEDAVVVAAPEAVVACIASLVDVVAPASTARAPRHSIIDDRNIVYHVNIRWCTRQESTTNSTFGMSRSKSPRERQGRGNGAVERKEVGRPTLTKERKTKLKKAQRVREMDNERAAKGQLQG